jgi:hypothetical protein
MRPRVVLRAAFRAHRAALDRECAGAGEPGIRGVSSRRGDAFAPSLTSGLPQVFQMRPAAAVEHPPARGWIERASLTPSGQPVGVDLTRGQLSAPRR